MRDESARTRSAVSNGIPETSGTCTSATPPGPVDDVELLLDELVLTLSAVVSTPSGSVPGLGLPPLCSGRIHNSVPSLALTTTAPPPSCSTTTRYAPRPDVSDSSTHLSRCGGSSKYRDEVAVALHHRDGGRLQVPRSPPLEPVCAPHGEFAVGRQLQVVATVGRLDPLAALNRFVLVQPSTNRPVLISRADESEDESSDEGDTHRGCGGDETAPSRPRRRLLGRRRRLLGRTRRGWG